MKKHGCSTGKSLSNRLMPPSSKLNFPTARATRWRIQWVGEGILNARVDAGVGELQIVRGPWGRFVQDG